MVTTTGETTPRRNDKERGGRSRLGRSPREWAVRFALTMTIAAVTCLSLAQTLAQVVVRSDPALAYRLAPWDGRMTAAFAASLSGPNATAADRAHADALAREALRHDPTAVAAISTLGLNAQIRGDKVSARRFFTYSERLSRRDLQTQLWMIEDSVGRGDIHGALHHYDVALRTKLESRDLLFPVLASASSDPRIREELLKTLSNRPLWASEFIGFVAANGPDPRSTAQLVLAARKAGVAIPDGVDAAVINGLLARELVEDAWSYYKATHPGADRRRSRDPNFATTAEQITAFDWEALNEAGMSTSVQRAGQNGVFDFSAPASVGGALLQQKQILPPGTYRLKGRSDGIEQVASSQPYWALLCYKDRRELGRVALPNSIHNGGVFEGRLMVPPGCPMQLLVLFARATDAVAGLSGQIVNVQLVPAG